MIINIPNKCDYCENKFKHGDIIVIEAIYLTHPTITGKPLHIAAYHDNRMIDKVTCYDNKR
jgi:hypothetical protein